MSRIGKAPIIMPEGVEIEIDGRDITITGPRGEIKRTLVPDISIEVEERVLLVKRPTDSSIHRSMHGLTRTLVANMVHGVSEGFKKELQVVGVGYRAQVDDDKLTMQIGYSHPVQVVAPDGISFSMEGGNKIVVAGIQKERVGQVAAEIRAKRPPDHYKGKGIRYNGEYVRLKAGKAGKVGKKK